MNILIETILNSENAFKLVNSAISYTNRFRTLNEVKLNLDRRIISLKASKSFICKIENNQIWLSYKDNGSRILLITE